MPIYEYRCSNCEKIIEVMQKFSDKPLGRCPSCSGKVSRIISNCSFQLKGTGWYVTDYKKNDTGGKKAESPKSDMPKSESTDSKDSKVEAKKT